MKAQSASKLTNTFCLVATASLLCGSKLLLGANADVSEYIASSMEDDFEYDHNNKLESHYVVFPAGREDCPTGDWDPGNFFTAMPLEGDALARVFPHYRTGESYLGRDEKNELEPGEEDNRCLAACLEKGTDIAVAGHTMPHYHYHGTDVRDASSAKKSNSFNEWFFSNLQQDRSLLHQLRQPGSTP